MKGAAAEDLLDQLQVRGTPLVAAAASRALEAGVADEELEDFLRAEVAKAARAEAHRAAEVAGPEPPAARTAPPPQPQSWRPDAVRAALERLKVEIDEAGEALEAGSSTEDPLLELQVRGSPLVVDAAGAALEAGVADVDLDEFLRTEVAAAARDEAQRALEAEWLRPPPGCLAHPAPSAATEPWRPRSVAAAVMAANFATAPARGAPPQGRPAARRHAFRQRARRAEAARDWARGTLVRRTGLVRGRPRAAGPGSRNTRASKGARSRANRACVRMEGAVGRQYCPGAGKRRNSNFSENPYFRDVSIRSLTLTSG